MNRKSEETIKKRRLFLDKNKIPKLVADMRRYCEKLTLEKGGSKLPLDGSNDSKNTKTELSVDVPSAEFLVHLKTNRPDGDK